VSPGKIENVLLSNEQIQFAAAVGVRNDHMQYDLIRVYIMKKVDNADISKKEIEQFAKGF
jgi:acyl-coenzyme A synthetase/AMP-(fatty) acid ligase